MIHRVVDISPAWNKKGRRVFRATPKWHHAHTRPSPARARIFSECTLHRASGQPLIGVASSVRRWAGGPGIRSLGKSRAIARVGSTRASAGGRTPNAVRSRSNTHHQLASGMAGLCLLQRLQRLVERILLLDHDLHFTPGHGFHQVHKLLLGLHAMVHL